MGALLLSICCVLQGGVYFLLKNVWLGVKEGRGIFSLMIWWELRSWGLVFGKKIGMTGWGVGMGRGGLLLGEKDVIHEICDL